MQLMSFRAAPYPAVQEGLPQSGRHIIASCNESAIVVYQAFSKEIAEYAVTKQSFNGCPKYSTERMTWVKTNFMWMMYRCGWCRQASGRHPTTGSVDPNQARVLAISLPLVVFDSLLMRSTCAENAALTRKNRRDGSTETASPPLLDSAFGDVRLQWDPDHDPLGRKLGRRPMHLGLKGEAAALFRNSTIDIQDVTDTLVAPQWAALDLLFGSTPPTPEQVDKVEDDDETFSSIFMPVERVYKPQDEAVCRHVMISQQ